MYDAMSIATSGLLAASTSLMGSASNIANMQTVGPVPATGPLQPVVQTPGSVYQPVAATQTTLPGGGVSAQLTPSMPAYVLAYDPSSPFANVQGMVAMPNVEPFRDEVNRMAASLAYKASLNVFKAADNSLKTLLDATH